MRRPAATLVLAAAVAAAQGPPVFEPGDTEGLKMSPSPQIRHAWKRKVFWKVSPNSAAHNTFGKVPPHTPAERQQMARKLDELVALFKATPNGSQGEGFWVNESRTLDYCDVAALPAGTPPARFPVEYSSGLFPFYHEDILNKGVWRLSVRGETESVYYYFNRLPGSLQQKEIGQAEFYLRPRLTARHAGLPIYEDRVLVVTRAGRDPWSPVPLGRVLKVALPLYEKDKQTAEQRLDGYRKTNEEVQSAAWEQQMRERFEKNNGSLRTTRPSNYAARLRSLEHEIAYTRQKAAAEASPPHDKSGAWYWNPVDAASEAAKQLAALTPSEAAQPACFIDHANTGPKGDGRYTMTGDLAVSGSSPQCRDVVSTNFDYFDLTLPRTAPQLLTVHDFGRCAKPEGDRILSAPVRRWDHPPQGCVQHAQMWRELDWAKFAALVQP